MNKELQTVTGKVQYVGTKFNGSLKLNDTFYNFAKGVKSPVKVGDQVILTLEPWEFKGKSGVNIVEVDIVLKGSLESVSEKALTSISKTSFNKSEMSKEEWAAKDQRISRQGVIQVAVQVTSNFEKAVELADKMLEYVHG